MNRPPACPLRRLAFLIVLLGALAPGGPALAAWAPGTRCSELPREAESLGNRHFGLLRRDSAGVGSAHFWHEFDDRFAPPVISLEGNVVRAVYKERAGSGSARPEPACPAGSLREFHVVLPAMKEAPVLQASEWLSSHELPEGVRVEVSLSYDCGGPIAQAGRQNLDGGQPFFLHRVDDRNLRAEVWHLGTGGLAVSPIVEAQGKAIRVGYREAPGGGAAVACKVFSRYTFSIQGVGTGATVELATHRVWSAMEWMLAGLAGLVGAAVLLAIFLRLRPARAATTPAP